MRVISSLMLGIAMMSGLCAVMAGQQRSQIEDLFAKLDSGVTNEEASAELRKFAADDPESRDYITKRLLVLIRGEDKGFLWYNSVQLIGQLKITEAAPTLAEALRRDHRSGFFTLGLDARLYDDPVAKSLSEIGEPAVDSVTKLFQDGDTPTRRRTTIVLSNIGSASAREAISRQIVNESDAELKAFMQRKLDRKE
jgi:HEAT repeat protein